MSLPVPVLLVFSLAFLQVRRVALESCFLLRCGFCTLTITHHAGEFCTRIITHHAGKFCTPVTTLLQSAVLGLECFFLIKRAFTCILQPRILYVTVLVDIETISALRCVLRTALADWLTWPEKISFFIALFEQKKQHL